jgi:hypothetical protein
MQVKLWYPDDAVIATEVPFYVPVKATVTDTERVLNEKDLEYEWEINNNLLSEPIPYSAYGRKHILCLAFSSVGLIRVTVTVKDTVTGETVTDTIDVFGQIKGADGIYRWDEEPVATYYDDRYVPNFTVQFRKKFKAGDEFSGAYNYFLGRWFVSSSDYSFDYESIENAVRELINRTTQPDQMWERFLDSDCKCYYYMKDPVDAYYPNKFNLMQLYNYTTGIGYHIKVNNDYPIELAQERLFQAVRFVLYLKGVEVQRHDWQKYVCSYPIEEYDDVLDKLDVYMDQKYTEMKSVIDLDNMYELLSDTVDDFLGQKSYDDNMVVYDWEESDKDYLERPLEEPAQV